MLMSLLHTNFFMFNKEILAFSIRVLISCPSFHSNSQQMRYSLRLLSSHMQLLVVNPRVCGL